MASRPELRPPLSLGVLWVRRSTRALVGCPTFYLQHGQRAIVRIPMIDDRSPCVGERARCARRDPDGLYTMRVVEDPTGALSGEEEPYIVDLGTPIENGSARLVARRCQDPASPEPETFERANHLTDLRNRLSQMLESRESVPREYPRDANCLYCLQDALALGTAGLRADDCVERCVYGERVGTPIESR